MFEFAIRSCFYPGCVKIEFIYGAKSIKVFNGDLSQMSESTFVRVLCFITCFAVIFAPIYMMMKRKPIKLYCMFDCKDTPEDIYRIHYSTIRSAVNGRVK